MRRHPFVTRFGAAAAGAALVGEKANTAAGQTPASVPGPIAESVPQQVRSPEAFVWGGAWNADGKGESI